MTPRGWPLRLPLPESGKLRAFCRRNGGRAIRNGGFTTAGRYFVVFQQQAARPYRTLPAWDSAALAGRRQLCASRLASDFPGSPDPAERHRYFWLYVLS